MASKETAILLRDIHGEKASVLERIGLKGSTPKTVRRGELLLGGKETGSDLRYQLISDPGVMIHCCANDVAPLSQYEYELLEAVKSPEARYHVLQNDLLDWATELKIGSTVYATLPSHQAIPNQHALTIIRYVGPLPKEPGVQFGVEIMDPKYRGYGAANGVFGENQFFDCEENCGLFVSLDRLWPVPDNQSNHPAQDRTHPMKTRSQNEQNRGNPEQQQKYSLTPSVCSQEFKEESRVIIYNKKGNAIHGTVRWTGMLTIEGGMQVKGVGIETDVSVSSKEVAGAMPGMGQNFRCSNSKHGKVVIPESMIVSEAAAAQAQAKKKAQKIAETNVDVPLASKEEELAKKFDGSSLAEQQEAFKKAKENKEIADLNRVVTAEIDRDEQIRELRRFEMMKGDPVDNPNYQPPAGTGDIGQYPPPGGANESGHYPPPGVAQDSGQYPFPGGARDPRQYPLQGGTTGIGNYPVSGGTGGAELYPVSGNGGQYAASGGARQYQSSERPVSRPPVQVDSRPSASGGASSKRPHVYESPDQVRRGALQKHHQHSVQDEQMLGLPSGNKNTPLQSQLSMPGADRHQHLNQEMSGYRPSYPQYDNLPLQVPNNAGEQRDLPYGAYQGPGYPPATHGSNTCPPYPPSQSQQPQEYPRLPQSGGTGGISAIASEGHVSRLFSIGSTVQLSDPPRYGVIQWIGHLPEIQGPIAGLELEDPMDGCGDGVWNDVRYFGCRPGHGLFCPLSSLKPDERFAPASMTAGNPLSALPLEENTDQYINPGQLQKYIGNEKGIQGHQNSCYLDSTVFGLFAASDAFDNMFLEQQGTDPDGDSVKNLLWKGIVNPLRKNGAVRHESVMRLRNKLEQLGKMKGVNQDEKDPEEFLNMLFKHTLHVPAFINIRRPFGVEQEYFIQLFVEPDNTQNIATVGDLLKKMFKEQNICFTKVPSKLLIQVPRFGREFKTYQKTIPGLSLKLRGLVSSRSAGKCFICGDIALKECSDCSTDFKGTAINPSRVYFCEDCAERAHRKEANRDNHKFDDIVEDGGVNELELLSVICIETSHYVCFTRSEERWIFFDSMANRVNDMYNIPKVVDCTEMLNEWVYPTSGDLSRLINAPPRELPEYVRRFTQDVYLCVYIQPDVGMYGDFGDEEEQPS